MAIADKTKRIEYNVGPTRVKSKKIGFKETKSNKALTAVGIVIIYNMVDVLEPYDVHTFQCRIYHGTSKVVVDNKSIRPFRTNLLIDISKLISYALAQLIWCSYFIQKTTIFNPRMF